MSGGGSGRDDYGNGGGGGGGNGHDPCAGPWEGPINSPQSSVLGPLAVGSVLQVGVVPSGTRPILVVSYGGHSAGSLTFRGYLDIIRCIEEHGRDFEAHLISISGGYFEVRVVPA